MAVLWLGPALYFASINLPLFLNDSGAPSDGSGDIFVKNWVGSATTVRGIGDFSGQRGVFRFMGIPYAKPPTGALRFEKPEPVDDWTGEKDATKPGHQCPQPLMPGFTDFFNTSEDCLYLNVYTPTRDSAHHDIPVMVWIHGGSFVQGSGSDYDGSDLARHGVVVVTFNYRLGALGFMSTEDDVIPGNFGLLDQIEALKWVQTHIARFGGDPNRVTLFGESSGAASVSLLSQSPLARGLFQRAIMQSGSSLTPWAYARPTSRISPQTMSRHLGQQMGCNQTNSTLFLHCMQQKDAQNIIQSTRTVLTMLKSTMVLVPRIETTTGVLPDTPSKLIASGQSSHIDTLHGYNAHESGALKISASRLDFEEAILKKISLYNITDKGRFLKLLTDAYIGTSIDPDFISQQLTAALSDINFSGPILNEIKLAVQASATTNHYLYKLDHRPSISSQPHWVTAMHGDDLPFLFGLTRFPSWLGDQVPTAADLQVANQMMTLWTNFAKTGNPTQTVPQGAVSWQPFVQDHQYQFVIRNSSMLTLYDKPKITALWNQFLQKMDNNIPTDVSILG